MSAPTGIAVSNELSSIFSDALDSNSVRFLKVSIRNESLVPDGALPPSGTLEEDLDRVNNILEDDVPAYILVKLDGPPNDWLAVNYVPDSAKVRDKMLYAATRNTLTKSLGSAHFTDSMFATSKGELSADSYAKHKQHLAAPAPMSAREKEMEAVKAAEREAGGSSYDGSRARKNHIGTRVGLNWSEEVEKAFKELCVGDGSTVMTISIDPLSEALVLSSITSCDANRLGSALAASEPSYAFFAWPQSITSPPRREIIFIYSCPSSSPIKLRMLYSSGARSVFQWAKDILSSSDFPSVLASRKIETSDPNELNEAFLTAELRLTDLPSTMNSGLAAEEVQRKPFARPKGPGRRR
ncbi:hypothetical protein AcW2_004599 [Taiwanofungus camphoratus]|nr:hypothetical protein AcW2_004599 [Antrodia cinnamomea]